jgi:hypothetical protein
MSYYPERHREQEQVSQAREPGASGVVPGTSARITAGRARGAALSVLSFDPEGEEPGVGGGHYFAEFER